MSFQNCFQIFRSYGFSEYQAFVICLILRLYSMIPTQGYSFPVVSLPPIQATNTPLPPPPNVPYPTGTPFTPPTPPPNVPYPTGTPFTPPTPPPPQFSMPSGPPELLSCMTRLFTIAVGPDKNMGLIFSYCNRTVPSGNGSTFLYLSPQRISCMLEWMAIGNNLEQAFSKCGGSVMAMY